MLRLLRKVCFFYYPLVVGSTLCLALALFCVGGGLRGRGGEVDALLVIAAAALYVCLVPTIPVWLAASAVLLAMGKKR